MNRKKMMTGLEALTSIAILLSLGGVVSCEETKMVPLKPVPPVSLCESAADCEGPGGDTFIRAPSLGCADTSQPDPFSGGASAVVETADGFIVIGSKLTRESGSSILALKVDRAGTLLWQRSFSPLSFMSMATHAVESDGGAVVALGDIAENDIYVLKIDAAGAIAWQTFIGGDAREYAWGIDKTPDGSILITGTSATDEETQTFVGKLAPDGELLWQKLLRSVTPGLISMYGAGVLGTADGGVIVTGALYDTADPVAVMKLDADGNLLWQEAFAGGAQGPAWVDEGADGSIAVLSGSYRDVPGGAYQGMLVMRLASNGAPQWQKLIALPAAEYQLFPTDILATRDGGLIVLGGGADPNPNSFDWGWKTLAFKLDAGGGEVWQKHYSVAGNDLRVIGVGAMDVLETADGHLALAGEIYVVLQESPSVCSDMLFMKTDGQGEIAPNCPFVSAASFPLEDRAIAPMSILTEVRDAGFDTRSGSLMAREGLVTDILPICEVSDFAGPSPEP